MTGVDLFAQEVAPHQVWMHQLGKPFRIVIEPTVVTTGKTGDRIDMRLLQGAGKGFRVKARTDLRNGFAGVKVEMDLAKRSSLWTSAAS